MEDERQFLTNLLESVQARLAALGGPSSSSGGASASSSSAAAAAEVPKSVRAYDAYLRCVLLSFCLFVRVWMCVCMEAGSQPRPLNHPTHHPNAHHFHNFHNFHSENLDPFLAAADALGGQAAELGAVVAEAWRAQRDFLLMAAAVGFCVRVAVVVVRVHSFPSEATPPFDRIDPPTPSFTLTLHQRPPWRYR